MFKWNDVVREKMSQILGYTTMLECGFVCIFFVRVYMRIMEIRDDEKEASDFTKIFKGKVG